ncbi:MAG: putative porin [Burkholderiales bacterium]
MTVLSRPTHLLATSLLAGALLAAFGTPTHAAVPQTQDELLDKLREKGVLTEDEYQALRESRDAEILMQRDARRRQALKDAQRLEKETQDREAEAKRTRFDTGPGVRSMQLYGDLRLRYEAREATSSNPAAPGTISGAATQPSELARERWRYAFRIGIRGDLGDDVFYGVRLDTGSNNRSAWVTFGDGVNLGDRGAGPSTKVNGGMYLGQAFLGWKATPWLTLQAGKMPNPFYTSSMVWDHDISPEGLTERVNFKVGDKLEVFGNFAQMFYQDLNPDVYGSSSSLGYHKKDALLFGWQGGASYRFSQTLNAKAALTYYHYEGLGASQTFKGDGPPLTTAAYWNQQNGINDLAVVEIPFEVTLQTGDKGFRVFGDYAINLDGDRRAVAAGHPGQTGENKAYQFGAAYGTLGTVYNVQAKKGTWEVRSYWQHVGQFALDPNLIDSDFFERTNVEGVYLAASYVPTDGIIGTFRYGFARQINEALGTGGSNPDLPMFNPIRHYRLMQFDLTWKF